MEGNCTLVPGGSPASNLLIMLKAEIEKCVVVFHMGLESFDFVRVCPPKHLTYFVNNNKYL